MQRNAKSQALTIILLCLTAVIAFGAEPPVQMATLRWNGDGEFMSWRWEKLDEATSETRLGHSHQMKGNE